MDPASAPSIWIERLTRLRIGFGDGAQWLEHTTKSVLTPDGWNHVAVSFDGEALRVFINGRLRDKAEATAAYLSGNLQTVADGENAGMPALVALAGRTPAASTITAIGAPQNAFTGTIDEVRIWNRPRSSYELLGDMNQRLTGRELGLAAYWRFDEAAGDTVFDQTDQRINGTIHAAQWVTSDAPVGDDTGLSRSSFAIAGRNGAEGVDLRTVESGMTAVLYYQQAEFAGGYESRQKKPLKQNARVMLALATKATGGAKNEIAAIDFGVSATGRIAEVPDLLRLEHLEKADEQGQSINQRLDVLADLERRAHLLDEEIVNLARSIGELQPVVAVLDAALANPPVISPTIGHDQYRYLNPQLSAYRKALAALAPAQAEVSRLEAERAAAHVNVFEHSSYGGLNLEYGTGPVTYGQLAEAGFNDLISSISISGPLQVQAFENPDQGGRSKTFAESASWVGDDFNDIISSMVIDETAAFSAARSAANQALSAAEHDAREWQRKLAAALARLQERLSQLVGEKADKDVELKTVRTKLADLGNTLRHGVEVPMPLVAIDRQGLTISAGLLGFAWTVDTPRLFDSATGSLALYFRGASDQFFVVYYTTLAERARYPLADQAGAEGVVCEARAADLQLDQLTITVRDGADPDHCTVTVEGAEIEEVWSAVPRDAKSFARALNGASSMRELAGRGTLRRVDGQVRSLEMPLGVGRSAIAAGQTLVVGRTGVVATSAAARGDTSIEVATEATVIPQEELPIYYLEYDYDRNARTTKVPNDLYNGSLLIRAVSAAGGSVVNQRVVSGSTLSSKWTAESPGSTLAFDGATSKAHLADTKRIGNFDASADLTMEAWLNPASVDERIRVLQHRSPDFELYARPRAGPYGPRVRRQAGSPRPRQRAQSGRFRLDHRDLVPLRPDRWLEHPLQQGEPVRGGRARRLLRICLATGLALGRRPDVPGAAGQVVPRSRGP